MPPSAPSAGLSLPGRFAPFRLSLPGFWIALLAAFLALLSGCSTYHWGASSPPPFQRLYVAPVVNRSEAPQIEPLMNSLLREALARDPRVRLVDDPAEADATLEVELTDYRRFVAATQPGDTTRGESFRVELSARSTLSKNGAEPLYEGRSSQAESTLYLQGQDLVQAEYQNLPVLARDLAETIKNQALDAW